MSISAEEKKRYFQETAIVLQREGFRVEPSVGGRLGVWLDDHPICEVDQIGGITYRSDNIPTPEYVAAKDKAYRIVCNTAEYNLTTHKKMPYLTMLGLRKGENEYTYAACTKQQAEELINGLREIAPYVVIDCSSYIANDILSAVALMEADSVLRLANCDLKSIGYLSSQLPLLRELHWDEDKQYKAASNIKPLQAADRIGQVLGSVAFQLPHSQELEEQYLEGTLLNDLSMKDSKAFRREIEKICKEVF